MLSIQKTAGEGRALVVGAGLAGSEAAWQLAQRGIRVTLIDMKPHKRSPAHSADDFAELVCSNSLRSDRVENAVGLLKAELRQLGSLILAAADATAVPAGGALAVDREGFSRTVTQALRAHPNIEIVAREIGELPDAPCILATGPLTSDALAAAIARAVGGESLYFFDAAAPIVTGESLDREKVFRQSRYERGDDYLNCPMNEAEYSAFYEALLHAECAQLHGFEDERVFEGCLPIEVIAQRGRETLAHGPLKPVGLVDPRTGRMPYAVVQLRQDNAAGTLYNIVGFQTHLKFGEQKRVFSLIPGLENAEFARYGVMHRNTFLNSPKLLSAQYEWLARPGVFFAGQMTGVEGYVESAASGWMAGWTLARRLRGEPAPEFGAETAIGALGRYISTPNRDFQPMNVNFGILEPLGKRVKGKQARLSVLADRSLAVIEAFRQNVV